LISNLKSKSNLSIRKIKKLRSINNFKKWLKNKIKIIILYIVALKKVIINNIFFIIIGFLFLTAIIMPNFNMLTIDDIPNILTILTIIPTALASILGALVAILLVSYEILRKTYASYAFKELFQSGKLKSLFTLYISTILISIVAITKKENIFLSCLSVSLFSFCIIMLYPLFKSVLDTSASKIKIKKIIDEITFTNINKISRMSRALIDPPIQLNYQIKMIEEHPIFELKEITIRAIKNYEKITLRVIFSESTIKLLNLLKENDGSYDNRNIINTFLTILNNAIDQAIEQKEEEILDTVLIEIEEIHKFCAKNNILWDDVIELNETLDNLLEKSVENGFNEIVFRGIFTVKRILFMHLLENVPTENKLSLLHLGKKIKKDISDNYKEEIQWEMVSTTYLGMLSNVVKKSIKLKKEQLIFTCINCFSNIASEIMSLSLGNFQKKDVISTCYYYIETYILECAENRIKITPFAFNYSVIERALENNTVYSKIPLIRFAETLIQLSKKGVLSFDILNMLGTLGRVIVRKINGNVIYEEALIFICETFNQIRLALEKNNKLISEDIFLELFIQAESIKKWKEGEKKFSEIIDNKIASMLSQFKKIGKYKEKHESKIIKWPKLNKQYSSKNKGD